MVTTGNVIIGLVSLIDVKRTIRTWTLNRCELSYWVSTEYQGKGFATELGKTVIDFVKNELKHQQIFGLIMEGNIASQTLLKKLSFQFEGSHFNTDYQIQLETYRLNF